MLGKLSSPGILVLFCLSAQVAAQDEGRALLLELSIGSDVRANFFEAPDGAPQEDVGVGKVELKIIGRPSSNWRLFAGLTHWEYYDLDLGSSDRGTAGIRFEGNSHRFDLEAILADSKPSVSVGDEFDRSDSTRLRARYSYRIQRDWELGIRGFFGEESFDLSPRKDSDISSVGAFVRYRGFGSKFSPEVGFDLGERDVIDPNEDYEQEDLILRLRSSPTRRLYLSLRLRERRREYSTSDPTARNFNRQDDRTQLALTAVCEISRHFSLSLYATNQDAESTKASRNFDSQLVSFWLTLRL